MDSTNNTPVMEAQAASIHVVSPRNLTLEYDAKDHTYLIPQKPIRLDARDAANPLPTIAVYSVQGPNTAKKDEPITFTVVTSPNTANIRLYNDNGTVLSPSSQTVTSNTDGTKRTPLSCRSGVREIEPWNSARQEPTVFISCRDSR